MPDPLEQRESATTDAPAHRRPRPRGPLTVGVIVFVVSTLVMLLPLVVSLGQLAKFVVTPAFVGACIGLSITANAGIDWWREGGGKRA